MFTQDSSQVLESQWGLPGPYFQWKEVPRDSSLLAPETETETVHMNSSIEEKTKPNYSVTIENT